MPIARPHSKLTSRIDPKYGVAASPRVVEPGQPVPKGGGVYRVGKPYQVAGRTYTPEENRSYRNEGLASWYGDDFHGRLTANGEVYDMEAISAAHPTLPMPSYVRVTNLATRKSLIVRVNDRGPYHANREIDLSARAADLLGFRRHGIGARARRICRPGAARGHRRPPADGDLARGRARAGAAGVMVASNRFLPNFGRPPRVSRRAAAAGAALRSRRARAGRVAAAYPQRERRACAAGERSAGAPRGRPRIADISPDTEPPRLIARTPACRAKRARSRGRACRAHRRAASCGPGGTGGLAGHRLCAGRHDGARAVATGRGLY